MGPAPILPGLGGPNARYRPEVTRGKAGVRGPVHLPAPAPRSQESGIYPTVTAMAVQASVRTMAGAESTLAATIWTEVQVNEPSVFAKN